jgi:3-oxoacyl-[acyl-carrier protein] reductase
MSTSTQRKLAVITGGNRGIGFGIAEAFALAGWDVAISGRDKTRLEEAVGRLVSAGARVVWSACDVRKQSDVARFFSKISEQFGRIDVLVNNAGIFQQFHRIEETPPELWREVIDTNLTGQFLCTRAAIPLIPRGGYIVNVLSLAVKIAFQNTCAYAASKHGMLGFTYTLREEMRERGVRVLAFIPGGVDSDLWNGIWDDVPRDKMMQPATLGKLVVAAVSVPENTVVEEIVVRPMEI